MPPWQAAAARDKAGSFVFNKYPSGQSQHCSFSDWRLSDPPSFSSILTPLFYLILQCRICIISCCYREAPAYTDAVSNRFLP